ncbi:pyridoxal-phosphate dependent enzyme [Sulfurimonas diazotrophicus]|uniref:Pyridoxal-phosphate dependent enzyme n=1 Tax=Sulfurimonas diazotrophicus TaxID=3131939 RepID=A0ABZ3H6A0_9BACT
MHLSPAPFEPFRFEGRELTLKRDDLIHPLFSGNKYRKLYALLQTPSEAIDTLVSYGGIQSNAMLSVAALCRLKGWRFEYTAKTAPRHLKADPQGNYKHALALGMAVHEVHPTEYDAAVAALKQRCAKQERSRLIAQGGADPAAEEGVRALAEEIRAWKEKRGIERLNVVTPSGTGTTAAYLARALPECRVVTVAAVGDPAYLQRQIEALMPLPPNLMILSTPYRFGSLDAALLQTYEKLKAAGVAFDLIYAPVMWLALMEAWDDLEGEVLYVHSGGVSGNETMLARYARRP